MNGPGEFFGTVRLIEDIMGQPLQITQMGACERDETQGTPGKIIRHTSEEHFATC
jgi:hypothetical protein